MKPENLINAVNQIHADAGLKAKVMGGEPAVRRHNPILSALSKTAACLAAITVLVLGVTLVPQILKPLGTTSHSSQTQGRAASANPGQPGMVNGLYHDDAIQNILLLGVDDSPKNDTGLSDSMLVISIDKRHNKLKLTSFLRDTYVDIPGYGKNKLNAAYHLGKAPLTVKTIENSFGIDIDHYVTINYDAFVKSVGLLGGVALKVSGDEAKLVNANSGESAGKRLTAGEMRLTGKQALYYSRIRSLDSDIGRTERQRKILTGIVSQLKLSSAGTLNGLMNDVLPLVTTDMDKNAVLGLVSESLTYLNYPVSQNRIPGDNNYQSEVVSGAGMVLVPDKAKNKQSIANFIYEDDVS